MKANNKLIVGMDVNLNKGAISVVHLNEETKEVKLLDTFTFPFENKKIKLFGNDLKTAMRDWYAINYISNKVNQLFSLQEGEDFLESEYARSDIIFVYEKNTQGTSYNSTLQTGKVLMGLSNSLLTSHSGIKEEAVYAISWRSFFKLKKETNKFIEVIKEEVIKEKGSISENKLKSIKYNINKEISKNLGVEYYEKYKLDRNSTKQINSDEADATLLAFFYLQKILKIDCDVL